MKKRSLLTIVLVAASLAACSSAPLRSHWAKDGVSAKDARRADVKCAEDSIDVTSTNEAGRYDFEAVEEDCMIKQGYHKEPGPAK